MNRNILMLVRREIWENRALWIAPLVLAAVLLVTAGFGDVQLHDDDQFFFGSVPEAGLESPSPEQRGTLAAQIPEWQRHAAVGLIFVMVTMLQLFVLGIVVFFYLLDCLLAERRDRSILFWKSLPISDGQVITSKALTALVVAPLIVLLVSAVTLPLFAAVTSLRLNGVLTTLWSGRMWLEVQALCLGFVPMVVLWYLPLAGYLMVVSAWVRKNAFLWAVLPPAALLLIENLITHTSGVGRFLADRFMGFVPLLGQVDGPIGVDTSSRLGEAYAALGRVFADYQIWLGAAVGLALLYLAARIRRYRDES